MRIKKNYVERKGQNLKRKIGTSGGSRVKADTQSQVLNLMGTEVLYLMGSTELLI
jgi:hypothetical protein